MSTQCEPRPGMDRLLARASAGSFMAVDLGSGSEPLLGPSASWCARVVLADTLFGGGLQHAERVNAAVVELAARVPFSAWPLYSERRTWLSSHADHRSRAAAADEIWWASAAAAFGLTILFIHDLHDGLPLVCGSGPTCIFIGWQVASAHFVRLLPRGTQLSGLHFATAADRVPISRHRLLIGDAPDSTQRQQHDRDRRREPSAAHSSRTNEPADRLRDSSLVANRRGKPSDQYSMPNQTEGARTRGRMPQTGRTRSVQAPAACSTCAGLLSPSSMEAALGVCVSCFRASPDQRSHADSLRSRRGGRHR